MKLAVSNIAWPAELDAAVLAFLAANGIGAIEVAPTRVWPHWKGINPTSVREFRRVVRCWSRPIASILAQSMSHCGCGDGILGRPSTATHNNRMLTGAARLQKPAQSCFSCCRQRL